MQEEGRFSAVIVLDLIGESPDLDQINDSNRNTTQGKAQTFRFCCQYFCKWAIASPLSMPNSRAP
jgi:hypothetical protein